MFGFKKVFYAYTIFNVLGLAKSETVPNDEYDNLRITQPDMYNWSEHPCKRACKDDEPSKICRYIFVVEQYRTMSKACFDCPFNKEDCYRPHCLPGDGQKKMVFVANRKLPGPSIEVCLNDTLFVEVRNKLRAETATIHWHGLRQKGTPYMDGVPRITQCAIAPGETFQYSFKMSESGTFFWHSHVGALRVDGLFGPLIVRSSPKHEIHRKLYDNDEHHMIIMDWTKHSSGSSLTTEYHDKPIMRPDAFLINGLGKNVRLESWDSGNLTYATVPSTVFEVEQGKRYRFRMIDAGGFGCPIEMSIDDHSMVVISLDGNSIEPVEVDVITIWPGERVDYVITANRKVGNYWIRYRGFDKCKPTISKEGIFQTAILRYKGASEEDPHEPVAYDILKLKNSTLRVFNPYDKGTESANEFDISISKLKSTEENDATANKNADVQFYLNYDNYPLDNQNYHRRNLYGYNQVSRDHSAGSLQLRHINFEMPPFPVLSQPDMVTPKTFCNSSWNLPKSNCCEEQCSCTHLLQIPLNKVVELILIDEARHEETNHAMHLHGNFFRVVAEENLEGPVTTERIMKLDREGKIHRNLDGAPLKDTMKIPSGGYMIARFVADNPGYWFFHCHFEQHTANGMALLFKVGDYKDFPPVPKGFPRCGGYKPEKLTSYVAAEIKK